MSTKPSDANEKHMVKDSKKHENNSTRKLTVRLTRSEKETFDSFAKSQNLSQKQLLLSLLENQKPEETTHFSDLLQKKQARIDQLKAQNDRLKATLQEAIEEKREKKKDYENQFDVVKKGISNFFELMEPTSVLSLQVETGYYADYPSRDSFHYPDKSGYYLARPIAILYGKGRYPARFVLAVGDNSELYKFRWYPKTRFVGVSIIDSRFSLRPSVWLIGCECAGDGAMDIFATFPLNTKFRYNGPDEYGSAEKRFVADAICEIDS